MIKDSIDDFDYFMNTRYINTRYIQLNLNL